MIRNNLSMSLLTILIITTFLTSSMRIPCSKPTDIRFSGKWVKFTFQVLTQQGVPLRNVKVVFAIANETHNFFLAKTPSILMLNDTGWLVTPENTPVEIWCPGGAIYQSATYNLSLLLIDEKGGHTFYRLLCELKGLRWADLLNLNGTSIISELRFIVFQIRTINGEIFNGGRLDGIRVKVFEQANNEYMLIWESGVNVSAYTEPFSLVPEEAINIKLKYWSPGRAGYLNYKLNSTLLGIQVWWHDIKIYENTCSSTEIFNLTGLDPIKLNCQVIRSDEAARMDSNDINPVSEENVGCSVEQLLKIVNGDNLNIPHIFVPYWIAHKVVPVRMIV